MRTGPHGSILHRKFMDIRAAQATPKGEGSVPVRENILPVYCEHGYITNIIACPHCGTMPTKEK